MFSCKPLRMFLAFPGNNAKKAGAGMEKGRLEM